MVKGYDGPLTDLLSFYRNTLARLRSGPVTCPDCGLADYEVAALDKSDPDQICNCPFAAKVSP